MVLSLVFGTLTILFVLLAVGNFTGNMMITNFAGFEGLLCGAIAIYVGMAELLNELYQREIMPIGKISESVFTAKNSGFFPFAYLLSF